MEKAPPPPGWALDKFGGGWAFRLPQEMAHFLDCIEKGKQPVLTGADGRAVLEVICAAYESARSGRRVTLPFNTNAARPVDLWLGERRPPRPRARSEEPEANGGGDDGGDGAGEAEG